MTHHLPVGSRQRGDSMHEHPILVPEPAHLAMMQACVAVLVGVPLLGMG